MSATLHITSFFSVAFELIVVDMELPYDLYVNSSSHNERDRFVRIFPSGDKLSKEDLGVYKKKYHQLYVLESQRDQYLRSLVKAAGASDTQKAEVIKDSAIHYLSTLFDPQKEFSNELLVEAIEGCRESVESMVDVVQEYDVNQLQELIAGLSYHDFYTYDHSINVSMYCIAIFKAMKPEAAREEIVMAGLGGLLHDLGKLKIPTTIINNPGDLTDEEFLEIKKHPDYGKELLDEQMHDHACDCEGIDFEIITRVVHEHHENYNGTGYPNKMAGEDIHLMARITAVADFFDAITTKRSYHDALKNEDALAVMARSVGKKIDPLVFKIFTEKVKNLVYKGKGNLELGDDFDPCRPHQVLPFIAVKAQGKEHKLFEKNKDYGKIKVDANSGKKKKAS